MLMFLALMTKEKTAVNDAGDDRVEKIVLF